MIEAPSNQNSIDLPSEVLDALMPMHFRVANDGTGLHVAPTLRKMLRGRAEHPMSFFEVFELKMSTAVTTMKDLFELGSAKLTIAIKSEAALPMRANFMVLPKGEQAIVDVSLGLSFAQAVSDFNLTMKDFSHCDQTVDLLYLLEANTVTSNLSQRLTQRLQAAHAAAEFQARTDVLTGLSNRRAIDLELHELLRDHTESFSVLQIDLDHFKAVNDEYGHAAGDAVLAAVGRILSRDLRRNDLPARIGGDEFLVVLRDSVEPGVVGRIANRLIKRIEQPIDYKGQACKISASIGVATTAQYVERPDLTQLMQDVDSALYKAKRAGRGRYAVHTHIVSASN